MPIPDYPERETCVAFLDVSGFKQKMREGIQRAAEFLDRFYGMMYEATRNYNATSHANSPEMRSIVISDCSVIFVDNSGLAEDKSFSYLASHSDLRGEEHSRLMTA